jgi:hypothetical protein
VNGDGNAIGGYTTNRFGNSIEWFHWTPGGGVVVLGNTWPILVDNRVFMSIDGSVMAATAGVPGPRAVRWTFPYGLNVVAEDSVLTDMNADGSIIVGTGAGGTPTLWSGTDALSLSSVVATRGIDTQGWELREPNYVAEDGSFVFGHGSCGGVDVTYRLVLSE